MVNINSDFYKNLKDGKIKINWNKNPIKMVLFLSFLTVNVVKSKDHLGIYTGWTLYENKDINLSVLGGVVKGVEYLESIQYGKNLQNCYNNYVNPFYLFPILNDEGKKFFINYYSEDIQLIIDKQKEKIERLSKEIDENCNIYNEYLQERNSLLYY